MISNISPYWPSPLKIQRNAVTPFGLPKFLWSVGHSNQKLSPKIDFWDLHHVYPLEHLKAISTQEIELKNQNDGSILTIKKGTT